MGTVSLLLQFQTSCPGGGGLNLPGVSVREINTTCNNKNPKSLRDLQYSQTLV